MPQYYILNVEQPDVNGPLLEADDVKEEIETLSDDDLENSFVLTLSGVGENNVKNDLKPADSWATEN